MKNLGLATPKIKGNTTALLIDILGYLGMKKAIINDGAQSWDAFDLIGEYFACDLCECLNKEYYLNEDETAIFDFDEAGYIKSKATFWIEKQ